MCCDSTMRQTWPRQANASDETAGGVQVVNDTNEPFGLTDQVDRAAVYAPVLTVEPFARAVLVTDDALESRAGGPRPRTPVLTSARQPAAPV
ncbi:hypothetical protein GCM10023089_35930 [Quisquiliibacterium transsilvanicum]